MYLNDSRKKTSQCQHCDTNIFQLIWQYKAGGCWYILASHRLDVFEKLTKIYNCYKRVFEIEKTISQVDTG